MVDIAWAIGAKASVAGFVLIPTIGPVLRAIAQGIIILRAANDVRPTRECRTRIELRDAQSIGQIAPACMVDNGQDVLRGLNAPIVAEVNGAVGRTIVGWTDDGVLVGMS